MRQRPVILAAAAGVAAAAAVLAAGGSAQAPGARTLTFRETDRGSTFGVVDNPPRSRRTRQGFPTRVSAGDTVAISQRLVQGSGPATGTIHVSCTATTGRAQRFDRAVFVCHATTTLHGRHGRARGRPAVRRPGGHCGRHGRHGRLRGRARDVHVGGRSVGRHVPAVAVSGLDSRP